MFKLPGGNRLDNQLGNKVNLNRSFEEIITNVSSIEGRIFESNPMISHFAQCYNRKPFPALKYASKIPSLRVTSNKKTVIL
jgi:hypothetical protein